MGLLDEAAIILLRRDRHGVVAACPSGGHRILLIMADNPTQWDAARYERFYSDIVEAIRAGELD